MTELFYNIFGDATRKVTNTPTVYNDENMGIARNVGKAALDGPIKPKEPTEKSFLCNTGKPQAALKKSFLSNAGKPLQSTPVHQKTREVFAAPTPIYNDVDTQQDFFEELEFTRPPYKLDNYHIDIFHDIFEMGTECPSVSPLPKTKDASMEFQQSYEDDFFTDNIVLDLDLVQEDDLPKIY